MSIKRHTAYNLGGAIAPVVLMLVTVPLYLDIVGEARYGVLAIVWLIAGYFSFFDFGLGRATAYAIARHKDSSEDLRAQTFWTALLVNTAFGVVGGVVMLLVAPLLFGRVFNLSPELLEEVAPVLPWLALAIPLLTFEGVFTGALTGRERFLALNARTIIGSVLTQAIPLICVWKISPTLDVAVPATILARALSVSLLAVISFRAVPAGLRPRYGGHKMARELLGYGGWISLSSILNPLIASLDRFLIAAVLNPVQVALYTVPYQLVSRASVFSNSLSTALFPRLAKVESFEARELAWRGMKANAGFMLVPCTVGVLILEPFMGLWIDHDFASKSAIVGQFVAITLWLNAVALIPFNLLQAQGRPKETTLIMILQVIPYILIAVPGIIIYGILGAAVARNVRSFFDVALLTYRTQLLGQTLSLLLFPLSVLGASIIVAQYSESMSVFRIVSGLSLIAVSAIWALFVSHDLRGFLKSHASRVFGKLLRTDAK